MIGSFLSCQTDQSFALVRLSMLYWQGRGQNTHGSRCELYKTQKILSNYYGVPHTKCVVS